MPWHAWSRIPGWEPLFHLKYNAKSGKGFKQMNVIFKPL
jgi:hypothetical protein